MSRPLSNDIKTCELNRDPTYWWGSRRRQHRCQQPAASNHLTVRLRQLKKKKKKGRPKSQTVAAPFTKLLLMETKVLGILFNHFSGQLSLRRCQDLEGGLSETLGLEVPGSCGFYSKGPRSSGAVAREQPGDIFRPGPGFLSKGTSVRDAAGRHTQVQGLAFWTFLSETTRKEAKMENKSLYVSTETSGTREQRTLMFY